MRPEASVQDVPVASSGFRGGVWIKALAPLVLLGAVLWTVTSGGSRWLPATAPPVERVVFQGVSLAPGSISAKVVNDGPDPVTIAQVVVDDAFWTFTQSPAGTVPRLGHVTIQIPYPWVDGEAHALRLLTSTGATFDHTIGVAVTTPTPTAQTFGLFALIGAYVGVLPVAIGLLWFPLMAAAGDRTRRALLALTLGLLGYLAVDSADDGLEAAAALPGAYQGVVLFAASVAAAWLVLDGISAWITRRRASARAAAGLAPAVDGWTLALLVAVGIGLHNLGEGLAIGSAFALGEAGLGTLLIVGFALHNTTEGLAIVAPLSRDKASRPSLADLGTLGLIGGAPTILGAWLGGFVYSPVWAVACLGLGVGAILQVMAQIGGHAAGTGGVRAFLARGEVLAGLAAGVVVMFVTGMWVG